MNYIKKLGLENFLMLRYGNATQKTQGFFGLLAFAISCWILFCICASTLVGGTIALIVSIKSIFLVIGCLLINGNIIDFAFDQLAKACIRRGAVFDTSEEQKEQK